MKNYLASRAVVFIAAGETAAGEENGKPRFAFIPKRLRITVFNYARASAERAASLMRSLSSG